MYIAVVGMCGSGKSSVSKQLSEKLNIPIIHFGDITTQILEERYLPVNEQNERAVREELRIKHGQKAYALANMDRILEAGSAILDGVYSYEEVLYLREKIDITIVCTVMDKELRYGRLASRDKRPLTREEAESRDYSELFNLSKGPTLAMADYFLDTNGCLAELSDNIDFIIRKVK